MDNFSRDPNDTVHPFQISSTYKDKKRHLFRFGRKKSRPDFGGNPFGENSILSARKKSKDYEGSIFSNLQLDILSEEPTRFNERKKSGSSSTSKGSIFFTTDEGRRSVEYASIDQEYRRQRVSISQQGAPPLDNEHWSPPDSWAVQPADESLDNIQTPALPSKNDTSDYFPVVEHEHWNITSKNFCIRIFRPDGTFGTLIAPLNATTNNLIQKLAGKFFLHDLSKYRLSLTMHNHERLLQLNERPIQIQKTILEQMGYTEEDKIEDIGREDNSYLFRFSFKPALPQAIQEENSFGNFKKVVLQEKNLKAIPIFLYKHAARITLLDLSKNLFIELPVDFLQSCKNLKQLVLASNDYNSLPLSIRCIPGLETLDISNNHINDLEPAQLQEIISLRSLEASNNRLDSLPTTFTAFKNLSILTISNNSFTKFPQVICQLPSLTYLDISFNKIASFPEEIGNLIQLERLFATANRLRGRFPLGFSKLENLQELDLRQNQITDLDELYTLPKLEIISVDYNAISVVNFNFSHLRLLNMSKNHLTQFNVMSTSPQSLLLIDLNLANCKLSSLPDDLFVRAVLLETLILDNNTLSVLPNSIGHLVKLTKLSVQGNNLETIPSEISQLAELKELDAQKNNLKCLPREIWLCGSLQTLNCSSNLLDVFPEPFTAAAIPDVILSPTPEDANNSEEMVNNTTLLSSGFSPKFNPPSFFVNSRNRAPPLSLSLRYLFLGDNRFTDDIWSPLSLFLELRTLNLCFNDLYEIPPEGLCHQHLYELYLSGNHLASLPADDIEKLSYLRVLAVNGNKLQTLPAEIGKLRKLLVLDVGNNVLKYNISNWPYDWNWNWNLGLKYLNLSGNKRLEIKRTHPELHNPKEKNLSDFSALTKLRMLGLMDITILGVGVPEEFHDRRVRTSPSEVNGLSYGVADWLGPSDHLATWDLVMPRFRNREDECLFALFDGRKQNASKTGCRLTRFLNDNLTYHLMHELDKVSETKNDNDIVAALRRTCLALEKEFTNHSSKGEDREDGASAVLCYMSGTRLYVANVGDALAVLSRNNGQAFAISQKHIPLHPSEISRIRAAGGYVSCSGLLNDELQVSRSFGYYHLIPIVNPNPYISTIHLAENDEFVIMASRGLWDTMSYQTAVDIARTEKDDLMAAAQKLRDFALTYGAGDESNIMVMVVGVGDLFDHNKRDKRLRNLRLGASRGNSVVADHLAESNNTTGNEALMAMKAAAANNKRRNNYKEESPSDSVLARLDREIPPPTNQVALVFTDIKSSTLLWNTQTEDMRSAIKIHDQVMRRTLRSIGGYEVKTEGDAFMVCFQDPIAALLWCFTVQIQLLEVDWPAGILETDEGREITKDNAVIYRGLSVRMGIHLGTPVYERNPITKRMDYFGPVVNKASRICNAADGGQICVSSDVIAALREIPSIFDEDEPKLSINEISTVTGESSPITGSSITRDIQQLRRLGLHVVELGERRLKGLETPEMLSLVYPKELIGRIEEEEEASPIASVTMTPQPDDQEVSEPSSEQHSLSGKRVDSEVNLNDPTFFSPPLATRHIDPGVVVSLNKLALRLEAISDTGNPKNHSYYSQVVQQRVHESASDEELVILIDHFVTRIENASSSFYLSKMGRFASVLEKLSEAVDLDPLHILRALQIYSEVNDLNN